MIPYFAEDAIRRHIGRRLIFEAIATSFRNLDRGEAEITAPMLQDRGSDGSFFGIKAGEDRSLGVFGFKAGGYAPANRSAGLPAHTSTTLLFNTITTLPLAIVEANYLNGLRTAAANAVAADVLARPEAKTLTIIGAGAQAFFEIAAVSEIRSLELVLVCARDPSRANALAEEVRMRLGIEARAAAPDEAVPLADILVTVTPSADPVVEDGWIRAGTHVAAMGADNLGKRELPLALFDRAHLIVDDAEQAARIGETQHVVAAGLRSIEMLRDATLGGILTGRLPNPRRSADDITVFDSTGLATQDLAAAHAVMTHLNSVAADADLGAHPKGYG